MYRRTVKSLRRKQEKLEAMFMKIFCILSPLQFSNSDLGHGAEAQEIL